MQILRILWERGEATVREVYEILRADLGIVQNTIQTFLRTMTTKGLVAFRKERRTFVYRACVEPVETRKRVIASVMRRASDIALDQLVASAVSVRKPTRDEIARLRELLDEAESKGDLR